MVSLMKDDFVGKEKAAGKQSSHEEREHWCSDRRALERQGV